MPLFLCFQNLRVQKPSTTRSFKIASKIVCLRMDRMVMTAVKGLESCTCIYLFLARLTYCDGLASVNNFFKHLLLNHWASLDETWQGCSLGEAVQNLFKKFNSIHNCGCHGNIHNSGCHGNQMEKMQNP